MLQRMTANGLRGTGLWLAVVGIYVLHTWPDLRDMDLNEFGDFLAGVVSPLALFWLILGYFQQGIELRKQSEETAKLAEAARVQGQVLQEDFFQRSQPRFEASPGSYQSGQSGGRTWIKLTNRGESATDLSVVAMDMEASIAPDIAARGEDVTITLHDPRPPKETIDITLGYRDRDGVARTLPAQYHFVPARLSLGRLRESAETLTSTEGSSAIREA